MAEADDAPVKELGEDKKPDELSPENEGDKKPEGDKAPEEEQETIGEKLGTKPEEETPTKPNLIPEAAFLEEKKGRKAAETRVKELEDLIKSGGTKSEVSANVDEIAEKFGVDKDFLKELVGSLETRFKKEADERIEKATGPLKEKERAAEIDKRFKSAFDKAMESMPEYQDIVNADVIKTLSLDPKNANKTFPQLIEETYSGSIRGKRTMETTRPRGGKEPEEIDFDRARKDTEYFKEIMANPDSKKAYNKGIADRIGSSL